MHRKKIREMEKELKDVQRAFWERLNPFKDEEFWYAFLEQSVQTYGRLESEGKITNVPGPVQDAIDSISEMQERYKFPTKQEWKDSQNLGSDLGKAFLAAGAGAARHWPKDQREQAAQGPATTSSQARPDKSRSGTSGSAASSDEPGCKRRDASTTSAKAAPRAHGDTALQIT